MRTAQDYLEDLHAEILQVGEFTAEGKAAFMEDSRNQYAVMMAYMRIGEIVKQLPDELLATQPDVPWRDIKGFRDVLIHRYFEINVVRVWDAVEQLPTLKTAVAAMLESLPDEPDETP